MLAQIFVREAAVTGDQVDDLHAETTSGDGSCLRRAGPATGRLCTGSARIRGTSSSGRPTPGPRLHRAGRCAPHNLPSAPVVFHTACRRVAAPRRRRRASCDSSDPAWRWSRACGGGSALGVERSLALQVAVGGGDEDVDALLLARGWEGARARTGGKRSSRDREFSCRHDGDGPRMRRLKCFSFSLAAGRTAAQPSHAGAPASRCCAPAFR